MGQCLAAFGVEKGNSITNKSRSFFQPPGPGTQWVMGQDVGNRGHLRLSGLSHRPQQQRHGALLHREPLGNKFSQLLLIWGCIRAAGQDTHIMYPH